MSEEETLQMPDDVRQLLDAADSARAQMWLGFTARRLLEKVASGEGLTELDRTDAALVLCAEAW